MNRLRWALADGATLTRRDLDHWARQPAQVVIGLLFPVMIVLMFGYLLGGGMTVPGGAGASGYREFLIPGTLALTMVFGLEGTFQAIKNDVARGVTDRFRSMPMASSAVVVGRSVADLLSAVVSLGVLVLCGLAIGWRWHSGLAAALAAFGLLLLLRFAMLWVGIYLGLVVRGEGALVAVQILVWPLGFLSNTFAAPSSMPGWLGAIASWNPLSSTVGAARELFGNPGWGGESWVEQHAILMAIVWPVLLIAIFGPLSVHRYRNLDR
ncbi:MAG TPA: ABC transporter permease [Asanoa sp.]|nr:ABC transporter permease [Asanoa sp.]